jgi:glutathione S-transferase
MYRVKSIEIASARMIELWELRGENDCRYSTFSWRTRLALLHKRLPFEVRPVRASDKEAIAFSKQDKVPILRDGDKVVADSWAIAVYLERTYPGRPSLFGGPQAEHLTQFFNLWVDRELIPLVVPPLMRDVLDCVDTGDAKHHRGRMEALLKKSLEDLHAERGKSLEQFRRRLSGVRKILGQVPFISGAAPGYADYILFSVLQWVRIVSNERALEKDDAVAAWFERVLDLYDGAGRRERPRSERIKESAA